jgi:hypothetical protein
MPAAWRAVSVCTISGENRLPYAEREHVFTGHFLSCNSRHFFQQRFSCEPLAIE